MSETKEIIQEEDLYETVFSRRIKYKIADFVSTTFLFGIIDAIAERMKVEPGKIRVSFSLEDGSSIRLNGKSNVKKLLEDSQKYRRHVDSIKIESGIIYADDTKMDPHFSLSFHLIRGKNYLDANISSYAVAGHREDSQAVIDWGNGTLKDFENLSLLERTPQENELIIKLDDGSVTQWSISDSIQKVEVVNEVNVTPSKLRDKANIIAIVSILVGIIIALVGFILKK